MNAALTSYLLAGALLASIAWHFHAHQADIISHFKPSACAPGEASCGEGDCAAAIAQLELGAEQRAALTRWSETACKERDACEAHAQKLVGELHALLSGRELDADKARELTDEIGRVRGRALRSCVESVIEVRRVLSPEQVEQLFGHCGPSSHH